jgi:Family of unknown function (DUF6326)
VRKLLTTGDTHDADTRVTTTLQTRNRTADLREAKVNVKVVLSGLWISMLFVFAYVDIFGFWRADVINGALTGKVPGAGFTINQSFLVFTTIYILIPSLMVVVSLLAPARINRTANIVASVIYAASVVVAVVGETWSYYIVGSVVEVVLLLAIARVAWTWPRHPIEPGSADV